MSPLPHQILPSGCQPWAPLMPIMARLRLQALCLPALSSEFITDLPNILMGAKDEGFPLLGPGMEANGPRLAPGTVAPSSAGLLLATAQEEKEAGSYGPSLMPVCRHFRPLAQSDHPTSSLYPLPRRRKLRLREEKACPGLCSREGERCGARRVLRASLWSPLYRPSWPPEHPRLPHHGAQCSHLGRAALEGMWRSLPQGQVWIQSPASAC